MQSYIYVDIDDEITTVIGKLKTDKESREVFLVVPKRAIIAQSLVNLQLLDKEARKIAKKLIFVSPDSHTRKIAEKAGLEVKKYVAKPEEPKQEIKTSPSPESLPKKLSPAEEAAAKEELNVVMGKSLPAPPLPANNPVASSVSIRPSTFASGSHLFAAKKFSSLPKTPPVSPSTIPMPPTPLPNPVPQTLSTSLNSPMVPTQPVVKDDLAQKANPSVVDLRKTAEAKNQITETKINLPEKESARLTENLNPFKVRSIIGEKLPTELAKNSVPEVRPSVENRNLSSQTESSLGDRSFSQQEKELANLTLREKERLRDLWMENKGVVRGKFTQKKGDIDLRPEKKEAFQAPKSFEENDGLIKTTRRIVSGSGKVVDLRAKKINIGNGLASADLKKKDQREILLPLVNVKFFSIFLIGILIVLLIVAGIILPRADIAVVSKNLASDFEMSFKVSGETSEINLADKNLPGNPVRFKLTQENIFSASGEKEVKEKSRGQVTFYNSGSTAVEIKKNSVLVGDKGKKYITLSSVTVPAATTDSVVANQNVNQNDNENLSAGSSSGVASAEVSASDFGSEYDLKSGATINLSSELAGISVKISRALTGGKVEKAKFVTEEDLNRAKEELTVRIKEKSAEEAKKYFDSKNDEILFPIEAGMEEISFSSSKDRDELGENFSAKLEVSFFALTFSAADAKRIAEEAVEAGDRNRGGQIVIQNFKVTNFNPLENQMEISANFQYKEKADLDVSNLKEQLVAKSRKEGESSLSKNSEVEKYSIKIFPSWLPWFPLLEKNIEIKVD